MSDEIRKRNAEDLRRAWNKFIKEQKRKNAEQRKQTQVYKGNWRLPKTAPDDDADGGTGGTGTGDQ